MLRFKIVAPRRLYHILPDRIKQMKQPADRKIPYGIRNMLMRASAVLTSMAIVCSCLCACSARGQGTVPVSRTGLYFDTVVTVTLYDYDGSSGPVLDECMEMCEHYESLFSATKEGSDIWNINHAEGATVSVDKATADLIRIALDHSDKSDGVLDLTAGALCDLWDISGNAASDHPSVPDQAAIDEALSHTGYQYVKTDGTQITVTDPDARINLGFIAKGYVADNLAEALRARGVRSALIDLGGNIAVIGTKPDGAQFHVGIQRPFADRGESIASVSVPDGMSVVSSGTYERFYTADDHIYHHIIDMKKGYPSDNEVIGVTVISNSSVDADALSTECLLLGASQGMKLIEDLDGAEAMFIASDYSLTYSSGWDSFTP